MRLTILLLIAGFTIFEHGAARIQVDLARPASALKRIWPFFGHDEPIYTSYMKDGRKLLSEFSALSFRSGVHALKWDRPMRTPRTQSGEPVCDWTITDRIFDTYVKRGIKPLLQTGFMPQALSPHPEPYMHHWKPGDK